MKNQALFSLKDKIKKLKCGLLRFLFGALRVNGEDFEVCSSYCIWDYGSSHCLRD